MGFTEDELFKDANKSIIPKNKINAKSKYSFAVVLPYYNEANFLKDTLLSWINQKKKPDQLILVNNNSTDNSEALAKQILEKNPTIKCKFLQEEQPGKLFALKTGCQEVNCDFIALSDADTIYPPHYLELCEKLFQNSSPNVLALMALPEFDKPHSIFSYLRRQYYISLHHLFKKHTFTGGYGQIFRTQALKIAGGFTEKIWPYVLMDHEIMYRIFQKGSSLYNINLWCQSSNRRKNRQNVRWNLIERLIYQFTPYPLQGWYFYHFLAHRFKKRGLSQLQLRNQPWQ